MNTDNRITDALLDASVLDLEGEPRRLGDATASADDGRATVLVFLRHYG